MHSKLSKPPMISALCLLALMLGANLRPGASASPYRIMKRNGNNLFEDCKLESFMQIRKPPRFGKRDVGHGEYDGEDGYNFDRNCIDRKRRYFSLQNKMHIEQNQQQPWPQQVASQRHQMALLWAQMLKNLESPPRSLTGNM